MLGVTWSRLVSNLPSTVVLLALSLAAHAQVKFDLPPQSLSQSLLAVADRGNLNVLFDPKLVDGLRAPALRADTTPADALARLLAGTQLRAVRVNETTVRVISESELKRAQGTDTAPTGSVRPNSGVRLAYSGSDPHVGAQAARVGPAEEGGGSALTAGGQIETVEQVVVTAQKREEKLQNVPIAITVLGTGQLESANISSVTDALSTVPGVATNQAYLGSGTLVTIRGVASGQALFVGSSPVAYYLDSVPFGLVKSAIAPDEDVYDLQRIEVLRGPQGTLYGASALNGVVRVLTNDADLQQFDFKARGSDSYTDGGDNNYRGDLAINIPLVEGKLAARAAVGYQSESGWIDSPVKANINDAQLRNYRLKLNAQPADDFAIGLSLWSARNSYGAPSTADDHERNSSSLDQPITTDFDAYSVKLAYSPSAISVTSTTSYLKYTNDSILDFTSFLSFPFGLFTGLDSRVVSEELLLNSSHEGVWRWSLGGIYRRATEDRVQSDSLLDPVTGFVDAVNDTSKSYAGFGEVTRLLLDGRLELTAGFRRFEDHVTQAGNLAPTAPLVPADGRFHATTPRAVITWHQSDDLMVYGSYSQGFRSGFPQDITVPVGFPPVNADKLYNYESGTKGTMLGGRVSFDAAVYYMKWKDVQQSIEVPFENVYTDAVVNGESASGEGIDLSIAAQPFDGLTIAANASWNNLEMDSSVFSSGVLLFHKGDRLNLSPATTAGTSAAYVIGLGVANLKMRFSASVNYTSAQTFRVNPGGPTILTGIGDPIVIGRLGVSLDSPSHWTLTAFLDNVNNEQGAVIRPYLNPDWTSRVRPRTGGLQLEYHFR